MAWLLNDYSKWGHLSSVPTGHVVWARNKLVYVGVVVSIAYLASPILTDTEICFWKWDDVETNKQLKDVAFS